MKKYAIIVAGGNGTRMNNATLKQFLLLKGKPVLYYAINTFLETYDDCKVILVLPEEYVGVGQEIIDAFFDYKRIQIIVGGRTRFHSVQNGLALVDEEDSVIFVHDAVRPLLTASLINRCYDAVSEFGTAIPIINCKDSVRIITENGNEAVERTTIKLVQTPQAFHGKILLPAFFGIDYKDKFTDEASVVEAFGLKVSLVEGEDENIKITNPADLLIAELIMSKSANA
ncbi:MAG: 2-C-methyl-D-erythritol 4-phosphate cytidylyltransferase [Ferruginibacter sp.]|nr:2-C-methyl-D-erythritol 4-phosphate cytidylyltransferase [Ferruginibacter sp.]